MRPNNNNLRPPLNIQLFAGANGYEYGNVELSQGEQAKYANSIMRALGGTNKMPLQGWFAESASKKEAYSVFYLSGRLQARDIDDTVKYAGPDYTPKDVKGQDISDFLKAIRVYPKGMECPVYVKRRDFDRSQLDEKSAIVDAQTSSIYGKCANRVGTLFKNCVDTMKRTVQDTNGNNFDLTIPTGNVYGDATKVFDTPENIKHFRMMMLKAQELAEPQGLKIGIVAGTEGKAELANAEKFSNKDYGEGETRRTGQPLRYLCGGEVLSLSGFDSVFYPTGNEETGYLVIIIEKAFGQDNKDVAVTPEANYIADKKSYLLDVEVYNSTELLNPEGFFIFKYKRDNAVSGASTISERTADIRVANSGQAIGQGPDINKVIELEKTRLEKQKIEKETLELKLKLIEAEKDKKDEEQVEAPGGTPTDTVDTDTSKPKKANKKDPEGTTE